MPARLLLVFALGVCFAADRFAVGDFGRFQRDLDIEPALQFGDGHLHVLLPGARDQELLGLGVTGEP